MKYTEVISPIIPTIWWILQWLERFIASCLIVTYPIHVCRYLLHEIFYQLLVVSCIFTPHGAVAFTQSWTKLILYNSLAGWIRTVVCSMPLELSKTQTYHLLELNESETQQKHKKPTAKHISIKCLECWTYLSVCFRQSYIIHVQFAVWLVTKSC